MTEQEIADVQVAILIPCYNEAAAIASVVRECGLHLPSAQVHVFDNDSTDDTAAIARGAGASVASVPLRGKGNVVRRMFADVDAQVYVLVDGDATYDLAELPRMVELLWRERMDMVVGRRVPVGDAQAVYRAGHQFGNRLLTGTVRKLFGGGFDDMLSGLRVFSRRYVKSFPGRSRGFEIETELTVHALELRMPIAERLVKYRARPEGSHSKLSTYRDGLRVLVRIAKLVVNERPLAFFTGLAAALALLSVGLAAPVVAEYMHTGLVPRLPTAVLATGVMLTAMLSQVCGAVLHVVTVGRQETKQLAYLAIPAPGAVGLRESESRSESACRPGSVWQ